MGTFDKMKEAAEGLKDKAGDLISGGADKAKEGAEKAGDLIDEKTGGEHADKVDAAQDKANDLLDKAKDATN